MNIIAEVKKLLKEGKLTIGSDLAIKGLRNGSVNKVFIASNCRSDTKETIKQYSEIGEVEVIELPIDNTDLGDLCKKPFNISVISVNK